jgi:hypothetical protein
MGNAFIDNDFTVTFVMAKMCGISENEYEGI